jgi:hypothetical protein
MDSDQPWVITQNAIKGSHYNIVRALLLFPPGKKVAAVDAAERGAGF